MRDLSEVRQARERIFLAREFLREKGAGENSVSPTFEFHAGALCALDWVLEGCDKRFGEHLTFLEKKRRELTLP